VGGYWRFMVLKEEAKDYCSQEEGAMEGF